MLSFLALLTPGLTTFLYIQAALLSFYGSANTIPFEALPLNLLGLEPHPVSTRSKPRRSRSAVNEVGRRPKQAN